jgi:hypothetical protein
MRFESLIASKTASLLESIAVVHRVPPARARSSGVLTVERLIRSTSRPQTDLTHRASRRVK